MSSTILNLQLQVCLLCLTLLQVLTHVVQCTDSKQGRCGFRKQSKALTEVPGEHCVTLPANCVRTWLWCHSQQPTLHSAGL